MKKVEKVVVEQDEQSPVEVPVLAHAIVNISKAFKDLQKSGLNRKAIVILVAYKSGQYQHTIERVLESLEQLQKDYTTK